MSCPDGRVYTNSCVCLRGSLVPHKLMRTPSIANRRKWAELGAGALRSHRLTGKWFRPNARSRLVYRQVGGMIKRFKGGFLPYHIYGRLERAWLSRSGRIA